LFDEPEDSLDTHNMAIILEYVQECMNVFVEMHGKVDKPVAAILFENTLRIEEVEQEQQTLVKEACPSVLTPKK
jgi:division protein CdvB (Snf7/Vps24/ESCRT-III family)